MSLVTTCPSCGTSFRITPEQLSAHRGDVRCGHCQHIFSALKQLEEITPLPPPAPQDQPPVEEHDEAPVPKEIEEPVASTEPEPIEVAVEAETPTTEEDLPEVHELHWEIEELGPDVELADEPMQEAAGENIPITEEIVITGSSWSWTNDAPPALAEPIVAPPEEDQAEEDQEMASVSATVPALESVEPDEPAPSARTDSSDEKPKRHIPSWLLALTAFLLVLTALAQTVYFLRNSIASRYPQTNSWLATFCQPLHCTLEMPHQADLLNIEDSDLKDDPEHEGVLVLVSMLDNRAPFTQAFPLLELTLTDTFDQPVLRRTFTPQEYLPAGIAAAQGIAAGGQIHLRLNLSVVGTKPAGYRLYVKY